MAALAFFALIIDFAAPAGAGTLIYEYDFEGGWSDSTGAAAHTLTPTTGASLSTTDYAIGRGSAYFNGTDRYSPPGGNRAAASTAGTAIGDPIRTETFVTSFWVKYQVPADGSGGYSYPGWHECTPLWWGNGYSPMAIKIGGGPASGGNGSWMMLNYGNTDYWEVHGISEFVNQWANVTIRYEGNGGRVYSYINGQLQTLNGDPTTHTWQAGYNENSSWADLPVGLSATPTVAEWTLWGNMDDTAIWSGTLTDGEAKAIYGVGKSELNFNAGQMSTLFDVFEGTTGPQSVGGLTWNQKLSAWPGGHNAGDAWQEGGAWYVQMDAGGGVFAVVPEPATSALIATGLIGLAGAWWRMRRAPKRPEAEADEPLFSDD